MAISNYSELQAAVANWLSRKNLDNRITEFIALCETRFHRELRVAGMEKRAETVIAISTEYVQLPEDFMETRNFQLKTTPVTALQAMSPDVIDLRYGGTAGKPLYYAIVGDEIQLAPVPDTDYFLEMDYWAELEGLSSTVTTNWMLENAPDIYLFGSLCEAIPFIQNDSRVPLWEQKYKMAVDALNKDSEKRRWPSSAMRMRIPNTGLL